MRTNHFKSGTPKVANSSFDSVSIYLHCEMLGTCKVIFWYFFGMINGYFQRKHGLLWIELLNTNLYKEMYWKAVYSKDVWCNISYVGQRSFVWVTFMTSRDIYCIVHVCKAIIRNEKFTLKVIEIDNSWLLEVAPHYYKQKELEDTSKRKMPKGAGKSREEMTRTY